MSEPVQGANRVPDVASTALWASFGVTAALLALAEQFAQMPGLVAAFAGAWWVVRPDDAGPTVR